MNKGITIQRLSDWLADSEFVSLRRDFALFIGRLLQRKVRNTTIPEQTDLLEVQQMLAERRLDWWEEWMQEGLEKGRLEGEAKLLQRQLEHRFGTVPEPLLQRLATASEEDLLRWSEAVLDASELDQIFPV